MNSDLVRHIYQLYSREIYFYIFAISGNAHVAEDIMQEVFVKAICSLPDSNTNIRAWLYKVAKNVYLNEVKKQRKHVSWESAPEQVEEDSTLQRLIQGEQEKLLYRSITDLPPNQRKILLLQYFSELSVKEIATVLNLSTENVRVLAHRGKKKLKEYIEVNDHEI